MRVYSEEALTGRRQMTSRAYLTFVTLERDGVRAKIPSLVVETEADQRAEEAAKARRAQHLNRRARSQDRQGATSVAQD
jgi:acyl-CoA hydrolase